MGENKEILNVEELATFLSCSTGLVRKLIKDNQIPFIKIGYSIRFEKAEVLKALKNVANSNE